MRAHPSIARRVVLAAAVLVAAALIAPASSLAATPPSAPTVTAAYTPAQIGVGSTTALAITITNPNPTTKLTNIGVGVELQSGSVIDLPNGATGACGSTTGLVANSGTGAISLQGGSLAGGANCVLSVDVTASAPGTYSATVSPVSSSQTTPYAIAAAGATASLQVFAAPTIKIAAPVKGATFSVGQKVKASYTCTDAAGAPGIASCGGPADSGQAIDTSTPGKFSFDVTAVSLDGATTDQSVSYTVLASNKVTGAKATPGKKGKVAVTVTLPGAGTLKASLVVKGKTVASTSKKVTKKGPVSLSLKAGKTVPKGAKVKLTFTPKGGKSATTTLKA